MSSMTMGEVEYWQDEQCKGYYRLLLVGDGHHAWTSRRANKNWGFRLSTRHSHLIDLMR